jgi:hypothetical protein
VPCPSAAVYACKHVQSLCRHRPWLALMVFVQLMGSNALLAMRPSLLTLPIALPVCDMPHQLTTKLEKLYVNVLVLCQMMQNECFFALRFDRELAGESTVPLLHRLQQQSGSLHFVCSRQSQPSSALEVVTAVLCSKVVTAVWCSR